VLETVLSYPFYPIANAYQRHDLFADLWKDRTNCGGLIQNPLLSFALTGPHWPQNPGLKFDFKPDLDILALLNYVAQNMSWVRIACLEEPNGGFNGRAYYLEKVLQFDALTECWKAEDVIGFDGKELFDMLAMRRDAVGERREKAERMVWKVLSEASMQKVMHGKQIMKVEALGVRWDKEENEGIDVAEGTFAELLRYGSVHFEQTREGINYVKAEEPNLVIRKGLLEP